MFRTRITEMLGIKYPIIQGGLGGGLSSAELVAAVSNAGGMGTIAAFSFDSAEQLREEIRKTKGLTDKPFAVNVMLLPTSRPASYEEFFRTAIEEGVKIVETGARSPEPYMKMLKGAGITVISRLGAPKTAAAAERIGVDILEIMGFESAGHPRRDVTTLVMIPTCADAVTNTPIIAAGGIVDARGFVAALALGAEAVTMGTRFVVSKEARGHPRLKEWFLKLSEADTMIALRSINNAQRIIRTDYTLKILELEKRGATLEEILPWISGRRVQDAYTTGEYEEAVVMAGQGLGLLHDILPVKDIIEGIIEDAHTIVERLRKMIGS